jgi:hypothetical protein
MKRVQRSRGFCCTLPMCAQFLVEFPPTFLGEEDSGTPELDATSSTGDSVGQPTGLFHVKIHVISPPDDERRRFQRLQLCFNGECVLVVEGREKALEVARPLFAPD